MRLFADPHRCPDCGAVLPADGPVCPRCHLDLTGPDGQELFATLSHADVLLARLRARSTAPSPVGQPGAAERPHRRLPAASVPKILLALGALCLLVAALVFLAVSWSEMGVGGRTATLVAFTVAAWGLAAWAARRALRGTAEALGTVALGLTTLDAVGARDAGWLGAPTAATFAVGLGLLLVVVGDGAAVLLRRTPAGGFTFGELGAVLGSAILSYGLVDGDWGDGAGRALVAVLVVGGLALLTARLAPLRVAAVGTWLVAVADWVVLLGAGLERVGSDPSAASVWLRLDGWGLLAAAAVGGALAASRPVDVRLRVAGLAAATFSLATFATVPAYDETGTTLTLAVLGTVAVAVVATALAPRPWATAGLAASLPGSLYLGVQLLVLGVLAVGRYVEVAATAWGGTAGGRLDALPVEPDRAAAWTVPLLVGALVGVAWSVARLASYGRSLSPRAALLTGGLAAALALALALLLSPVPVWAVLLVLLATGAGAVGVALAPRGGAPTEVGPAALPAGAVVLAVALPLSWYDAWLTLGAVGVALLAAVAARLRSRTDWSTRVAGAAVAPLAAGATWTGGELVGGQRPWVGLVALLVLAALALAPMALGRLPGGRRSTTELELGSAAAALGIAAAGLDAATGATVADWTAVYLTVGGTAAALQALLREDRRPVGWLGGALLAAATWVRLADLGVEAPEPYTLPAAVALLVTGGVRLLNRSGSSSLRALTPGLTLALVPSLLWAIEEPLSLRALLLGVGCLGLVVAGLRLRWSAPLLHGAVVGAALVVREAGPYVGGSVPRWALIGMAGALLVVLGTTWEQRIADARTLSGYLRGLR